MHEAPDREVELNRWAGQVLIAGFEGGSLPARLAEDLRERRLSGVILFKRNLKGLAQVRALMAEIHGASAGVAPLIGIDQEGGRVERLGKPVLQLPPMATLGKIDDLSLTRASGEVLGRALVALGFNLNFAPVLDVATNPDNPVIGDRAFSADPERVALHGMAFAEGLHAASMLSCGKHFPGHGDTSTDSHFELPSLPHDLTRLQEVELHPFRRAADVLPCIMTAHILFKALDPERPATLSQKVITGLLREQLGYRGLVISDDLEMKAIASNYRVGQAAMMAIDAGCDLALICRHPDLVDDARRAIALRASEDAVFADKLKTAAERVRAVRAGLPPFSSDAALDLEGIATLEDRIAAASRVQT